MSDPVENTAGGATRVFFGSLAFILLMVGVEGLKGATGITGQTRRQKRPSPSVPTARRQQRRGEGECRDVADVLLDRLLSGPGLSLHAHAERHLGSDR
jgi:hypothetical protein